MAIYQLTVLFQVEADSKLAAVQKFNASPLKTIGKTGEFYFHHCIDNVQELEEDEAIDTE
jgi:hypothetical protein